MDHGSFEFELNVRDQHIAVLEAKLAKAIEVLSAIDRMVDDFTNYSGPKSALRETARSALKELADENT
jgi:hypothetical protein